MTKQIKQRALEAMDRCEKATEGPWVSSDCAKESLNGFGRVWQLTVPDCPCIELDVWGPNTDGQRAADVDFIANSRTDLPWALKIVLAACEWQEYVTKTDGKAAKVALNAVLQGKGPNE